MGESTSLALSPKTETCCIHTSHNPVIIYKLFLPHWVSTVPTGFPLLTAALCKEYHRTEGSGLARFAPHAWSIHTFKMPPNTLSLHKTSWYPMYWTKHVLWRNNPRSIHIYPVPKTVQSLFSKVLKLFWTRTLRIPKPAWLVAMTTRECQ